MTKSGQNGIVLLTMLFSVKRTFDNIIILFKAKMFLGLLKITGLGLAGLRLSNMFGSNK